MKAIQYFHLTARKIFSFEGKPAKMIQCTTKDNKAVIMCQKLSGDSYGELFGIDPQGEIVILITAKAQK